METREVRCACALFGVVGPADAVRMTYYGLFALQHRGQESAGIASSDGRDMKCHKGMGLVGEVFDERVLAELANPMAIGQTRYSTTGASRAANTQPLVVSYTQGPLAVAHNGNLVNARALRDELERRGSIFQTTTDSEVILHLMACQPGGTTEERIVAALNRIRGAFSLLFLVPGTIYAVRDPNGFRPICLGKLDDGHAVASETSALELIGARFLREVEPGEMVAVRAGGIEGHPYCPTDRIRPSHCIFEHIYFARPDSVIFGEHVHDVRVQLGRVLAREHPAEADVVIPVPDSGNSAALGYARESGIPLDFGFIRNHYIGRTFIQPTQGQRDIGVKLKLNVATKVVRGKRVVVVDDSVIRGTTSKSRIKVLRDAGAAEIHFRVSCPPNRFSCHYGIDFPTRAELLANNLSIEQIRDYLELDSIGYLSHDSLLAAVSRRRDYCHACFSGEYPVPVDSATGKFILEGSAAPSPLQGVPR